MRYEPQLGTHLNKVCRNAVQIANDNKSDVTFRFNGTEMTVSPGNDPDGQSDLLRMRMERKSPVREIAGEMLEELRAHVGLLEPEWHGCSCENCMPIIAAQDRTEALIVKAAKVLEA